MIKGVYCRKSHKSHYRLYLNEWRLYRLSLYFRYEWNDFKDNKAGI